MKSFEEDPINVVYAPPEYMSRPADDPPFPEEDELITPSGGREPVTTLLYSPPDFLESDETPSWSDDPDTDVYPYSHAPKGPDTPEDPGNPMEDVYGGPDLPWEDSEPRMDTVYGGPRGRGLAAAVNAILSRLKGDS